MSKNHQLKELTLKIISNISDKTLNEILMPFLKIYIVSYDFDI
jgi:hypothetical protein